MAYEQTVNTVQIQEPTTPCKKRQQL